MSDRFGAERVELTAPGSRGEVADYSAGNHTFSFVPRYLKCSASGILKVDLLGGGTNIDLPVVPGVNPERVTRIYNSGSTAMTVTGLD
jgi:hypothetical protein